MNIHTTLEDRGVNYGSFEGRCRVEQTIKRAFASGHQWDGLPDDCRSALEMIATKVSRIVAGNNPEHHDSWLDISGYATLVADRLAKIGGVL